MMSDVSLPPPRLEPCGDRWVLRDDLLPGGTKRRAIGALLDHDGGEFVYASPAFGYAQLAIAYGCADRNLRATIFTAERKALSPITQDAAAAHAAVYTVPAGRLNVVTARARQYAQRRGAVLLPHGLDTPAFVEALAGVARALPIDPPEVWCAAGSGTLARALGAAWPSADIVAVQVGHQADAGRARVITAPEAFARPARLPPPFPSAVSYDAKVWRYFAAESIPGALFWNVAA
jgi:hypothetical protein